MKAALLVIDLQKVYCEHGETCRALSTQAAAYANEAARIFREKNLPIVAVYHGDAGGPKRGDADYEFIEAVKIGTPDIRIDKVHGNAFWATDLESKLRGLDVDTVVLSGYCAEYCVLSTARGASERGFFPMILRGGIASGRAEHVEFVERIEESITLGALEKVLS